MCTHPWIIALLLSTAVSGILKTKYVGPKTCIHLALLDVEGSTSTLDEPLPDNRLLHFSPYMCIVAGAEYFTSSGYIRALLTNRSLGDEAAWFLIAHVIGIHVDEYRIVYRPRTDILPLIWGRIRGLASLLTLRGYDPDAPDLRGTATPLQIAVGYGMDTLVECLLKDGANPNGIGSVPPLVIAASRGDHEMVGRLLAGGADKQRRAQFQHLKSRSFYTMSKLPGLFPPGASAELGLKFKHSNIYQPTPKHMGGWLGSPSGPRGPCNIDMVDIRNLSFKRFAQEYVSVGRPVLLLHADSNYALSEEVMQFYSRDRMRLNRDRVEVVHERWPDAKPSRQMAVSEYVELLDRNATGDEMVFSAEWNPSKVWSVMPYSQSDDAGFEKACRRPDGEWPGCQFMLGPNGSGMAEHWHRSTMNVVIYGAKLWRLTPPAYAAVASLKGSAEPPGGRFECEQRAGEAIYVPADWGHEISNLGEAASVACDCRAALDVDMTYLVSLAPFKMKYDFLSAGVDTQHPSNGHGPEEQARRSLYAEYNALKTRYLAASPNLHETENINDLRSEL